MEKGKPCLRSQNRTVLLKMSKNGFLVYKNDPRGTFQKLRILTLDIEQVSTTSVHYRKRIYQTSVRRSPSLGILLAFWSFNGTEINKFFAFFVNNGFIGFFVKPLLNYSKNAQLRVSALTGYVLTHNPGRHPFAPCDAGFEILFSHFPQSQRNGVRD